jgi:enoyl-CoA hydratase/carnithine racemase
MPITTTSSLDGTVLEIVLDRPKANTIDATTSRELSQIFDSFNRDTTHRVAILTAAGEKFFSAGWDLNAANEGEAFDSDYGVGGFGGFPELPNRNKPIIAAVNGMAVGGGFEIAMAADFIVAADHAQFFLPETRVGVLPDATAPLASPPVSKRNNLWWAQAFGNRGRVLGNCQSSCSNCRAHDERTPTSRRHLPFCSAQRCCGARAESHTRAHRHS